ncbi:hypothetical protein ASG69_10510 [Rhodococcus sp. Leaf225]|nr:hypothetical protein ASG69_10510 [Rhodococcus sp. Leaf225]KQU46542.1 hypothetical protein ASH03_07540 [Rhodococcus sp. Leaf258]
MTGTAAQEAVPVNARLDLLFKIWRTEDGSERSPESVASDVSVALGRQVAAREISALREGTRTATRDMLEAIATVFPSSSSYLLDDSAAPSIHSQLSLIEEVLHGGITGMRLRTGDERMRIEHLTDLLGDLRRAREAGP